MNRSKKPTPALVVGLIFMTALVVLAGVLGVNVIRLSRLTAIEAATTPTPEPEAANVMQVTIDPNEPTLSRCFAQVPPAMRLWNCKPDCNPLAITAEKLTGNTAPAPKRP